MFLITSFEKMETEVWGGGRVKVEGGTHTYGEFNVDFDWMFFFSFFFGP